MDAGTVAALRELDLLYDRSPHGEFLHFYTHTIGSVFFEFVEHRGNYDGYGSDNAPVADWPPNGQVRVGFTALNARAIYWAAAMYRSAIR